MAIVVLDPILEAGMRGRDDMIIRPHPSEVPLPDQRFDVDVQEGKVRWITATQLYFLNMSIAFTSTASEQRTAFTDQQNFPLFLRSAWTNMTATDVRVRMKTSRANLNWSSRHVLVGSVAGRSRLVEPHLRYRRGFVLAAQTTIQGDWINSPTAPEGATSRLVFMCERPEQQVRVPVSRSMDYRIDVSLGLSGGATGTGQVTSQQIAEPILIYGAITDAQPLTTIRIMDTQKNVAWSSSLLPIGAFCGIDDGTNVQQIVRYPKPYLLAPNSTLQIDWLNADNDSGKFIAFLGERILSQQGAEAGPGGATPTSPGATPPTQVQAAPPQIRREYYGGPISGDNDFTDRMMRAGWRWDGRRWFRDVRSQ